MSIDRKYPLNDLRLKDILEKIYSAIDQLQQVANRPAGLNPADLASVTRQVQAGLLGVFGTPVIGGGSDPKLQNLGLGTVTGVTAGDLSPLFTTTETGAPTPNITFTQVVQNANLVYAGPASGAAANPTFRSLVAADFTGISAPLLSSTVLNLNTNTKQPLYTVPAGKSALILWVVARSASVDLSAGVTTLLSFGFNAGSNDWSSGNFGTPALTLSSLFQMMSQTEALAGQPSVIGTAGQTFGTVTDIAFGSAATLVIEIFGYVF